MLWAFCGENKIAAQFMHDSSARKWKMFRWLRFSFAPVGLAYSIGTHTDTSNEWSSCFYFEPTVNRKWIMRYKQNTWPIHVANNIYIQYQANVFCFWYPLNFMFAAAATCRFAESNLYHVFKTSRNCSARKHNKFGCVSVKVIHSTLALFNLNSFWHSKNQMHKIIHRSIDYFEKKLRTKTKKKHI